MNRIKLQILKALADGTRLKIMDFLKEGEKNVGEIKPYVGTTQSNVSQHLRILKDAGIVDNRRKGKVVYYYIVNKKIFDILDLLDELVKENIKDIME
ncbi:MAG: winged helix-turn-helix transcriptional regulator [Methanomicrobia archaeon]|nr:winged helix-turn-helix transcriptional regulator [Methanomicrobia archaeon]HDM22540.1 ArsR family transcriptional regulator [Methanomicrobia archaeon]